MSKVKTAYSNQRKRRLEDSKFNEEKQRTPVKKDIEHVYDKDLNSMMREGMMQRHKKQQQSMDYGDLAAKREKFKAYFEQQYNYTRPPKEHAKEVNMEHLYVKSDKLLLQVSP